MIWQNKYNTPIQLYVISAISSRKIDIRISGKLFTPIKNTLPTIYLYKIFQISQKLHI